MPSKHQPLVFCSLLLLVSLAHTHPNHSPFETASLSPSQPSHPSYESRFGAIFVWHALSALTAWAIVFPLFHLASHFQRQRQSSSWFLIHRIGMFSVLILTGQAYIIGLWKSKKSEPQHLVLGSVLLVLLCLQALGGILRPAVDPSNVWRRRWENMHRGLGISVTTFAVYLLNHSLTVFKVSGWIKNVVRIVIAVGIVVFIVGRALLGMLTMEEEGYEKVQGEDGGTEENLQQVFVIMDDEEEDR